jgi:hypothetical protein
MRCDQTDGSTHGHRLSDFEFLSKPPSGDIFKERSRPAHHWLML